MPSLFEPLTLRSVTLKNRIGISPMCQYSSADGVANDWHLAHLGSRAVGGAGLIFCEATAVESIGRISPGDAGLWNEAQAAVLQRINAFLDSQGAVPGIQLAHAGRKASTCLPWDERPRKAAGKGTGLSTAEGGWEVISPSPLRFAPDYPQPKEMSLDDIRRVVTAFRDSARLALGAGYRLLELHAAHGYLGHSFLSPLANHRSDHYGGSFENRIRFVFEMTDAVREVWPERYPLFVRISASDWVPGGWTIEDSVALARALRGHGVDLVDCSSGGIVPDAKIPAAPNYQVPFAERVKKEAEIPTAAVGLITEPAQADEIIRSARADLVLLARASLRDPYWPIHAAQALGATTPVPKQYERAISFRKPGGEHSGGPRS